MIRGSVLMSVAMLLASLPQKQEKDPPSPETPEERRLRKHAEFGARYGAQPKMSLDELYGMSPEITMPIFQARGTSTEEVARKRRRMAELERGKQRARATRKARNKSSKAARRRQRG